MLVLTLLVLAGFSYPAVELTSGPGFCHSCHEIAPAVASWKRSPHAADPKTGKRRADCRDCHVPSWKEPWAVLWVKVSHGAKDFYHHAAGHARPNDQEFYFELKHRAQRDVPDQVCLGCHQAIRGEKDVVRTAETGEVRGLHASSEARKVRCLVCHKNTGHDLYE